MDKGTFSVLLIDDSYVTRDIFQLVFEHYGLPLAVVADGESALNYLDAHTPSVIVVDLYLSDTDGWTVFERIRKVGFTGPVVATTSYHTSRVCGYALFAGFDCYLPKPIDVNYLVPNLVDLWKTYCWTEAPADKQN